jgi:hypothetical protein
VILVALAGIFTVLRVATSLLRGADPRLEVPARNFTVPVVPPGAVELTVAVD